MRSTMESWILSDISRGKPTLSELSDSSRHNHGPSWAVTLTLLAVIALLAGTFFPERALTLHFPDSTGTRLLSERRKPVPTGTIEQRAEAVVSELLIGSGERGRLPLFSGDVRLLAVMERSGILYVDISSEALETSKVSFPLAVKAIHYSLRDSVPGSGKLVLTIDGEPTIAR